MMMLKNLISFLIVCMLIHSCNGIEEEEIGVTQIENKTLLVEGYKIPIYESQYELVEIDPSEKHLKLNESDIEIKIEIDYLHKGIINGISSSPNLEIHELDTLGLFRKIIFSQDKNKAALLIMNMNDSSVLFGDKFRSLSLESHNLNEKKLRKILSIFKNVPKEQMH